MSGYYYERCFNGMFNARRHKRYSTLFTLHISCASAHSYFKILIRALGRSQHTQKNLELFGEYNKRASLFLFSWLVRWNRKYWLKKKNYGSFFHGMLFSSSIVLQMQNLQCFLRLRTDSLISLLMASSTRQSQALTPSRALKNSARLFSTKELHLVRLLLFARL